MKRERQEVTEAQMRDAWRRSKPIMPFEKAMQVPLIASVIRLAAEAKIHNDAQPRTADFKSLAAGEDK